MEKHSFRKKMFLLSALSCSTLFMTEISWGWPDRLPFESNMQVKNYLTVEKQLKLLGDQTDNLRREKSLQDELNKKKSSIAQLEQDIKEIESKLAEQEDINKSWNGPDNAYIIQVRDNIDHMTDDLNENKTSLAAAVNSQKNIQAKIKSLPLANMQAFTILQQKERELKPGFDAAKRDYDAAVVRWAKEDEEARIEMEHANSLMQKQYRVQAIDKEIKNIEQQKTNLGSQHVAINELYQDKKNEETKQSQEVADLTFKINTAKDMLHNYSWQDQRRWYKPDAWGGGPGSGAKYDFLEDVMYTDRWAIDRPKLEAKIKNYEQELVGEQSQLAEINDRVKMLTDSKEVKDYLPFNEKIKSLEEERTKLMAELNPPRTLKSAVSQKLEPQFAADEASPNEELAPAMPVSDIQQQPSNDASMSSLTADCEKNIKTTTAQIETLTEENNQLENLIKQQSLCKTTTRKLESELHQLKDERKALTDKLDSLQSPNKPDALAE